MCKIADEQILHALQTFDWDLSDWADREGFSHTPSSFGTDWGYANEGWFEDLHEHFKSLGLHKVSASAGATRVAFIRQDCDYVLKANLPFCPKNYNALEIEAYEHAADYGIQSILLPVQNLFVVNQHMTIIKQPRYQFELRYQPSDFCQAIHRKTNFCKHKPRVIKEEMPQSCRINDAWWLRAYQIYGKRFMWRVVTWAEENGVNDLHGANVGYYRNKPCIFDYAGFHD